MLYKLEYSPLNLKYFKSNIVYPNPYNIYFFVERCILITSKIHI